MSLKYKKSANKFTIIGNDKSEALIRKRIIEYITNKYINNVAIVTHTSPDGDAIGSSVALALALESINKKVDVIIPKQSFNFNILTRNVNIIRKPNKSYDLTILLDCSSVKRTIYQLEELSKFLIVIDHHIDNPPIGNLYLCKDVASTTMIIYQLLLEMHINISPMIATALYAGIIGDTSYFSNNNVTSEVYIIAADLLNKGANLEVINEMFLLRTLEVSKLVNDLINKAILNREYHIIYTIILREDLEKYNLSYNILNYVMHELKNIKEAEIAFLFIESDNSTKIKVRSRGHGIVNKIMQYFDGGGHKYAAGASINSVNIYSIVDTVISQAVAYINMHPEEFNFVHTNECDNDDNIS